jgi:hypothetical protein
VVVGLSWTRFSADSAQDDITQVPGLVGSSSAWLLHSCVSLHLYHEYYHLIKYKRGSKFNKSKEIIEIWARTFALNESKDIFIQRKLEIL